MVCAFVHSLREQISEVRRDVLSDIQEWGRLQEELKAVQQSVFSLLSVLQNQSDPSHLQVRAHFTLCFCNTSPGKVDDQCSFLSLLIVLKAYSTQILQLLSDNNASDAFRTHFV